MTRVLAPVLRRTPGQDRKTPPATRVAAQRAAARRAVRECASRQGVSLGALRKAQSGAPMPCAGWHYSLSHSSEWVAGILHCDVVGVDVERIQERRARLIERALSSEEAALLEEDGLALAFTRAWTAKESVLKRAGVGLGELSACRVVERVSDTELLLEHRSERHLVRQLRLDDHIVAVHAEGTDWSVDWSGVEQEAPTS